MPPKRDVTTSQPPKPKARVRVKGRSADDPGLGNDLDALVMGAAPVTTVNDHIVLSPIQAVDHVKRRRVHHTSKWTASRKIAHADERQPQSWIIKEPHSHNKPTCMECHQIIESGEVGIARKSDQKAGGRWTHCRCLPGGLHPDDRLELVGTDSVLARQYIDEHEQFARASLAIAVNACEPTLTQSTPQPRVLAADTQQPTQRQLAEQGLAEMPKTLPQSWPRRGKLPSTAGARSRSRKKLGPPGLSQLPTQEWHPTQSGSPAPLPHGPPVLDAMEAIGSATPETAPAIFPGQTVQAGQDPTGGDGQAARRHPPPLGGTGQAGPGDDSTLGAPVGAGLPARRDPVPPGENAQAQGSGAVSLPSSGGGRPGCSTAPVSP